MTTCPTRLVPLPFWVTPLYTQSSQGASLLRRIGRPILPHIPDMAVYPGDAPVRFTTLRTIKDTGYHVSEFCMSTHAGTHVDVPFHVILDDRTVDKLSLEALVGEAEVLDFGELKPGDEITSAHLDSFVDRVKAGSRLLLKTGWGKRWGKPGYFDDFPGLSEGAAMWLASREVGFVGLRSPSHEPGVRHGRPQDAARRREWSQWRTWPTSISSRASAYSCVACL